MSATLLPVHTTWKQAEKHFDNSWMVAWFEYHGFDAFEVVTYLHENADGETTDTELVRSYLRKSGQDLEQFNFTGWVTV